MLIWSDLILGPDIDIDILRNNYIGISKEFECRWSYKEKGVCRQPSEYVAEVFVLKVRKN